MTLCVTVAYVVANNIPRRQLVQSGCGPRSLYAVARALGVAAERDQVNGLFPNKGEYVTFDQLAQGATSLRLRAKGQHMTVEDLRRERPRGILHVDDTHFVGLVGYDDQSIFIAETLYGEEPEIQRWLDGDLAARWDGRILVIDNLRKPQ